MRSSTVRLLVGQIQGKSPRKRRLICKRMKAIRATSVRLEHSRKKGDGA